jgi:hypothetical protein
MKSLLLSFFYLILVFSSVVEAEAQKKKSAILQQEPVSGEGSITLLSGEKLSGTIKFNDTNGTVTYENEGDSKTFIPKGITGFEFYEGKFEKTRRFYSLEYNDPETDIRDYFFFEVIKEFESFAVMSKVDRINTKTRLPTPVRAVLTPTRIDKSVAGIRTSQDETIFLIDSNGRINPYVKIVEVEREKLIKDTNITKNKFINKELLEELTVPHYDDLVQFARKNELDFKLKSNLLQILEYYETLVKK